ncbi:hypothetical protein SAMN02745124_04397 [Desulfofustis glycolicus DSM 9705]|uniref:Uncharacterized protein n=1 Tax=Desulfofustis glycolicus DSM 9705 TaxID=1121409 RepID=A0A1M5YTM6_9BACT|nr:hypothetical protein SAMN02745124_04397 [Desulfofustis glycolicus DSM 9705]
MTLISTASRSKTESLPDCFPGAKGRRPVGLRQRRESQKHYWQIPFHIIHPINVRPGSAPEHMEVNVSAPSAPVSPVHGNGAMGHHPAPLSQTRWSDFVQLAARISLWSWRPYRRPASNQGGHPLASPRHTRTYIHGSMLFAPVGGSAMVPSNDEDHSTVRSALHPGKSGVRASLCNSWLAPLSLFGRSFFKSILRLGVTIRMAGIRFHLMPSVAGKQAIHRRRMDCSTQMLLQRLMKRWDIQDANALRCSYPRLKKSLFFGKGHQLSPSTAPGCFLFGDTDSLFANLPLHSHDRCNTNAEQFPNLGVRAAIFLGDQHAEPGAKLPGGFGLLDLCWATFSIAVVSCAGLAIICLCLPCRGILRNRFRYIVY